MKISFHNAFNGVKYIAAAAVVSMALIACGDDGPTKSENVEHGDKNLSSSSVSKDDGKSSSSKGEGSSDSKDSGSSDSKGDKDESSSSSASSVDVPKGARAATLSDLEKNMSLGKMFGTEVYLASGAQHGLFSLWVPDTAWIAVSSDFENGVLEINSKTGAFSGIVGPAAADSMKALLEKGITLGFVVTEGDSLKFTTDGGKTYNEVGTAQVKANGTRISKGDDLKGIKLTCNDKKDIYTFFEGRYYAESIADGKVESWSAGYYDIQRSYLMMLPKYFEGKVNSLSTYFVEPDTYTLSFYGNVKADCEKSVVEYSEVASKNLVNEWESVADGNVWTLNLKGSGSFDLSATKGGDLKQAKEGAWNVYGNMLFLHATACLNKNCTQTVKGVVSEFDPKVGFELDHNDKAEPVMPSIWTLPQYE